MNTSARLSYSKRISNLIFQSTLLYTAFAFTIVALMIIPFFLTETEALTPEITPILVILGAINVLVVPPLVSRFYAITTEKAGGPLEEIVARYSTRSVLILVIREAGVIMGFSASYSSGEPVWVLVLGALAIIGMIFDWPQPARVRKTIIDNLSADERHKLEIR